MICIKSNGRFIFSYYFNRERLTKLIGQVHLLANCKILRTWKLCNLKCKDCSWIRHAVCFLWHQMDLNRLANFQFYVWRTSPVSLCFRIRR